MTNEELILRSVGEIVERLVARFSAQASDHETKMAEHRAAFGARTEADAKIIEWLRIKVQDARAERDALRAEVAALQERLRASIARGDFAQMEVAALKSQTPKHPVKVGEWVRRTKKCAHFGHVAKVLAFIEPCSYEVQCIEGRGIWYFHNCEPCDTPEATHDTEAGKAAAESAAQHSAGIDIGTWSRKVTT